MRKYMAKTNERHVLMTPCDLAQEILCDVDTDGGGWIVLQKRQTESDFDRTWDEYKKGFVSPPGDFWLGNELIHQLTSKHICELRIDMTYGPDNEHVYAQYSSFLVEDESHNYRLRLGSYSGTAGETSTDFGFSSNNGQSFSTPDRDNSPDGGSCPDKYHLGWWRGADCDVINANLNGRFEPRGEGERPVLQWNAGHKFLGVRTVEMKIRRV
ncbi:ficolin-1 [Elysia marginata]|uniref:Ficolin-1 n=1 Tax=Elysia marginata TaxID=1093978 RepID=A0AAV4JQA1_9GAST|nr:ficolin-1 [Elysia marginata]